MNEQVFSNEDSGVIVVECSGCIFVSYQIAF
jgi:hypothetical protein